MARDWSLQLKGAWKRYGADILFEDLDLQINPGMAVRVTGPNGSGKTQLLLALSGLVPLDRGELQFAQGNRVNSVPLDPHVRDRYVRFVPEKMGALSSLPAAEVILALSRSMNPMSFRSRRRAAAERFALEEARLGAVVGASISAQRPAAVLSIGQQKRLAIAAIGGLPNALLFDEPLAGLDTPGIRQVLKILLDLRRAGVAIVVAEHRSEIESLFFDEVLAMPYRRPLNNGEKAVGLASPSPLLLPGAALGEPRLVLRNVTAGYPGREISCRELIVRSGELVKISGSNGVGKTGFLKALVDAEPARLQGHAELDGHVTSDLRGFMASGAVRYMSQDRRTFAELTAIDALRVAGAAGRDLPGEVRDLAGIVGERKRVADLSSGNRALVVLGQTLASRPRLALLDEPFANVDAENRRRMISLIAHARQHWGTAFVWVEHGGTETFEDVRYHIVLDHDKNELQRVPPPSDGSHFCD